MATNPFAVRTADFEALKGAATDWSFLWSEFQSACEEADRYGCETVQPADEKIRAALSAYIPNPAASAAEIARELTVLRFTAVPDYELIHCAHAALLDDVVRIQALLMQAPAPDQAALFWKIEHLTALGTASREARASVAEDARRLLAPRG